MRSRLFSFLLLFSFICSQIANAQVRKIAAVKLLNEMVHRSTLTEPGSHPFYLKATISETKDPNSENNGTLEEYWVSPTKYRRIVKLRDFSQLRVVNGDQIFEENTGDYFPVEAEKNVSEIVDPIPADVIALFAKLSVQATEPGQGKGQCMAQQYYNNEDGNEERALLAYDCQTGFLIYVWSPTCCYGVMTDYRKFHGKMVAYGTKDDPITIHIDTLKDLDKPEESLFAVAQPSAPEKRLITTVLRDSEARRLIASPTDIHWPPVENARTSGQLQAHLRLDRDGKIRDLRIYGDGNDTIKKAAEDAVRKWTFHPYTVDGVPAQVETKLIIPFSTVSQASMGAKTPDINDLFTRMRGVSILRLDGAAPFHLKASFHTADNSEKGTYEETWVSPSKWWREVKFNDGSLLEVKTEEAFYRVFPGKFASRIADDVVDAIFFDLPGDNGGSIQVSDWRAEPAKLGNVDLLAVTAGYVNPQGRPDAQTLRFMIDPDTASVRGRFHHLVLTLFNDLQPFAGKRIARKLTALDYGTRIEIDIDTLEPAATVDESLFQAPATKPLYTADTNDPRYTTPRMVRQVKPSIAGWHGKAECSLFIDEHGHVRQVEVKDVTDEAAIKAIKAALLQWEYEPATFNGRPGLSPAMVTVQ